LGIHQVLGPSPVENVDRLADSGRPETSFRGTRSGTHVLRRHDILELQQRVIRRRRLDFEHI
jgi:hypothetical protein